MSTRPANTAGKAIPGRVVRVRRTRKGARLVLPRPPIGRGAPVLLDLTNTTRLSPTLLAEVLQALTPAGRVHVAGGSISARRGLWRILRAVGHDCSMERPRSFTEDWT